MADLTRGLAGDGKPSLGTFLRVMDIVLEQSGRQRVPSPARPDKTLER